MDIDYASELGYKIKHIATARSNNSQIECKVHPALVNKKNILSKKSVIESLIAFKRAGANAIVTYFADNVDLNSFD